MTLNRDEKSKLQTAFAPYRFLTGQKMSAILTNFAANTVVEGMSLKYCPDAMDAMGDALASWTFPNTTLCDLRLHNCNIGTHLSRLVPLLIEKTPNLKYLSLNNNELTDDEFDAILPLLAENKLVYLDLENTHLSEQSILKLAHILESNETSLQSLNLSSNHLTKETSEILIKALFRNTTIKTLFVNGDNEGQKHFQTTRLADIIKIFTDKKDVLVIRINPSENLRNAISHILAQDLKTIDLSHNNEINTNFTKEFVSFLNDFARTTALVRLRELILDNNQLGSTTEFKEILRLLETLSLQALYLRSNGLTVTDLHELHLPRSVKKLNLENNPLGANGIVEVVRILKENRLELLDLEATQMGNDGAIILADALRTNTSLKRLVIQNNGIEDDGALALLEALNNNQDLELQHLDIQANYLISPDLMIALADVILNKKTITSCAGWFHMPEVEDALQKLMGARLLNEPAQIEYAENELKTCLESSPDKIWTKRVEKTKTELFPSNTQEKRVFEEICDLLEEDIYRHSILSDVIALVEEPHNQEAQQRYNSQIIKAQKDPSPERKKLGKLLIILGALVLIAAGIVVATTLLTGTGGLVVPIASGIAGGVSGLAMISSGFFKHKKQNTQLSYDLSRLQTQITKP